MGAALLLLQIRTLCVIISMDNILSRYKQYYVNVSYMIHRRIA